MMKRKITLFMLCTLLCASLVAMGTIAASADGPTGWEKRADEYYYEVNPPITDLMEFGLTSEQTGATSVSWYRVNYTGYLDNGSFRTVSRAAFDKENNQVQSYFTSDNGDNSAKEILLAEYDDWGILYPMNSGASVGQFSEVASHMDFTFNLDFTDLNTGWFTYLNDTTKITFQLTDNQIIFEQKADARCDTVTENNVKSKKINYNYSNLSVQFVSMSDYNISLKDLTGMHKITILIEDRVSESFTEVNHNDNKGAIATVTIDDTVISYTFEKMGYYVGVFGFANYTNAPLSFYSTKASIAFNSNNGQNFPTQYYALGATVNNLPELTDGARIFDGWYTTSTFENGTKFENGTEIASDLTLYARWLDPDAYNAEGWKYDSTDGFYYEENPPITDLFEYHGDDTTGDGTNTDWYIVNYSGYIDTNAITLNSRKLFNAENNIVQSYFNSDNSDNAAKEILLAQRDWGIGYTKKSVMSGGGTNENERHLDFVFYLDFTNLTKNWFTYLNDATKITFQISNNQLIFEQKSYVNGLNYKNANTETYYANLSDYGINLAELTGNHRIAILIEDRVVASTAEITRDDNHGARATVCIDEVAISQTFNKMGYYAGVFGIVNYTDAPLVFYSTHPTIEYETNCATNLSASKYNYGDTVAELPTLSGNAAYVFEGWYTTSTFENGTKYEAGSTITKGFKLYAHWVAPESPNAEGWVFNPDDGYFYEPDPVLTDLFEYHGDDTTGDGTNTDWYIVNYSGYIDTNPITLNSRKLFTLENNTVQSYFNSDNSENAAKEILLAQRDWGIGYTKKSGCYAEGVTNEPERHMDFAFCLDFTNLTKNWFTYLNDSTKITFNLSNNQLIFEQKSSVNGPNYKNSSTETYFVNLSDYSINLASMTGNHKIVILIEDRVIASTAEITRNDNHGARVTVYIDDTAITQTFNKMGYYSGVFGIVNYTDAPLVFSSTHNHGEWIEEVPATCEATGTLGHYYCADCEKNYDANYKLIAGTLTIDALGHTYGEWIAEVAATCEAAGTLGHYTCSECKKNFDAEHAVLESLEIAATGHTYGEWIAEEAATCEVAGTLGHYTCSVCKKNFDAEHAVLESLEIAATGHTYGEWIAEEAATCEVAGTLGHYTCSVCKKNFDAEHAVLESLEIAATGHDYVWVEEVPATEEAAGTKAHWHCNNCGKNFDENKENELSDEELIIAQLEPQESDESTESHESNESQESQEPQESTNGGTGCFSSMNVGFYAMFVILMGVSLVIFFRKKQD